MARKFEVRTQAERFIHNDLSSCAWWFEKAAETKIKSREIDGVYFDLMAGLVMAAFSVEAKVNFVGWKLLENDWPERAKLREKIDLLVKVLNLDLSWGERPLQTVAQLKRFRDTLAHGKPELVDLTEELDIEPTVWDALKGQWEASVRYDFLHQCRKDEDVIWRRLLDEAEISISDTLTSGRHSLKAIVEQN